MNTHLSWQVPTFQLRPLSLSSVSLFYLYKYHHPHNISIKSLIPTTVSLYEAIQECYPCGLSATGSLTVNIDMLVLIRELENNLASLNIARFPTCHENGLETSLEPALSSPKSHFSVKILKWLSVRDKELV